MKRDWDLIREVLTEVEALDEHTRDRAWYKIKRREPSDSDPKAEHGLMLWKAGFIDGIDGSSIGGPALGLPELTWQGHELLETIRSKPIWDRIKKMAQDKGIELTFDAVKQLAAKALAVVIAS
jgi:hypothetical protein